jgi:hypothetical protein
MRPVLALLLAALLAAGCGDTRPGGSADEPESPPSAASPTGAPSGSLAVSPSPTGPPSAPTDTARQVTVTGAISLTRDQRTCVDLVDEATGVTWTLVGAMVEGDIDGAGRLADGDRVTVTGRVRPEVEGATASYACSVPITVERLTRL